MKRFTIRGMLIAIAVIAVLLALPDPWRVIAIAFSLVSLSLLYARRLHSQDLLGAAGYCFWIPAVLVNFAYAGLSITPGIHLVFLCVCWFVFLLAPLGGFGIAWARLVTRGDRDGQLSPARAWLSVVVMTLMPLVTAWTAWPFQLRFLMARPALERMADRVAAGQVLTYPQWAGPFQIDGSRIDPASGNVGLMISTNPNGPTGFIRNSRPISGPYGCFRPFRGDWCHLSLTGGWCYHEED